jgi:hypothetical protein
MPNRNNHTLNAYLPDPWIDGLVHLLVLNSLRPSDFRWRAACQQILLSDTTRRFTATDEPVNCMHCMLYTPGQGPKR